MTDCVSVHTFATAWSLIQRGRLEIELGQIRDGVITLQI